MKNRVLGEHIMTTNKTIKIYLTVICLGILAVGLTSAMEQEESPAIEFNFLTPPAAVDAARIGAVGRALDFQHWPQTAVLHVAPLIDVSLLSRPELVTRQTVSYGYVLFEGIPWGKYELQWNHLSERPQPMAEELPADLKERYLQKLRRDQRDNPEFVEEYLRGKLDRYRKSKQYQLEGEMQVEVCLSPASRAAQEYLLDSMTGSMMATPDLVRMYRAAPRPEGLGNTAFLLESRRRDSIQVMFVRANLCVKIRANGTLANEALPVAEKIDLMITQQPVFTSPQLLSRRPTLSLAAGAAKGERTVPYRISVSPGHEVLTVRASMNGQQVAVENGNIYLPIKKGKAEVKLVAITHELLAGYLVKEIVVDE
jgi:hypothetical protein